MSHRKRTGLIQGSKLHKIAEKKHNSPFELSGSPFKATSQSQNMGMFGTGGESGYDVDKLSDEGYDYDMMKKRRWWKRGGVLGLMGGHKDKDLVAYNRGFEVSDFEAMEPL